MGNIILPFISDYEETTTQVRYAGTTSYFVEAIGLKRIKIGRARDVAQRLATLRTGSAVPLVLRATTTIPERDLHRRFRRDRVCGEWFNFTDEIAALIEEINNPAKPTAKPKNDTDEFYFTPTQAFAILATFFVLFGIIWATFSVNNTDTAPPVTQKTDAQDKARVVVLYQQTDAEANKPVFRSVTAEQVNRMSTGEFQEWAAGVGKRLRDEAQRGGWKAKMEAQHRELGGYFHVGANRHLEFVPINR
jgi:hypothetical protein